MHGRNSVERRVRLPARASSVLPLLLAFLTGCASRTGPETNLVALGMPFDRPEFFDRTIADLRLGRTAADRARRLLERYVPVGPQKSSAAQWAAWWRENQPYAFASDSSDYCWYVDPLARKRGIPTSELRGPRRADAFKAGTAAP